MTVSELIKKLSSLEKQEQEICIRGNNSFIIPIEDIIDCSGDGEAYVLTDGELISEEKAVKDLLDYCHRRCHNN